MPTDQESSGFERLPLRLAWEFLRGQGLGEEADEIRNSKDKIGSYDSTLKRAKVTELLKEKMILDEFIEKHWPLGKTNEGKKLIRRYESIYSRWASETEDQEETEEEDIEATSFAIEQHLRDYLERNLSRIEPGLKLFRDKDNKNGVEYPVDSNGRRIDILAVDKDDTPVIIELKVSRGHEKVIGQCLYYRGRVKQLLNSEKARIVIVAREITPELRIATESLTDVELYQYELNPNVKKV